MLQWTVVGFHQFNHLADHLLFGLGIATLFSFVLVGGAPFLAGRLPSEWTLWGKLATAWLAVNLAKAPVLIAVWLFMGATTEPTVPGTPASVELLLSP